MKILIFNSFLLLLRWLKGGKTKRRLDLLMVLAIYGKATLLLSVILINGACHIWQGNISVIRHFQIPLFFRRATPPAVFVTEPWMRCQNVRPNREWCAMTFISDRGYDVRPRGEIAAKKKRIDLTLRKTLTPRSSESGFHRNVKFATFEEAGRLCKTIPQNGVKVAPLGGRSVPKLPHWLSMV